MRPIIEDDIDEEEGLDTLSSLPPSSSPTARPSLHGLDRELSTKFGTSMDSNTNNNDSSRSGQQQQNMSYTDYLQAQKKMQSRRHLVGASAAQKLLRRLSSDDDGGDGDRETTTPTAGGAQQSMQTNLTVLAAAAKLRRRSAAAQAAANNNKTAKEQKTLRALEAWGRRGSTVNLMAPDEAVQWDAIFRYVLFVYIIVYIIWTGLTMKVILTSTYIDMCTFCHIFHVSVKWMQSMKMDIL